MSELPADFAVYLWARSLAHEHLLRGIWAQVAARQADPPQFMFETIEELIASIDRVGPETDQPIEGVLRDAMVNELRLFADQVKLRLGNRGYPDASAPPPAGRP